MRTRLLPYLVCASISSSFMAGAAWAETSAPKDLSYTPVVGQAGKDVVWVPTSQQLVDMMLDMADLQPDDKLVDLGSGDGRTVITAAKRGIPAHGIEYNPDLVAMAKRAAKQEGVADRATFELADIFESDFSDATVVTLFLLPALNMKLRPTLLDMPPGTRVISNSFTMEDWSPDETGKITQDCKGRCIAYKWVVPADAAGTWKLDEGELNFKQTFQVLDGEWKEGDKSRPVTDARLNGKKVAFTVDGQRYEGEINGDTMRGTINGARAWTAKRAG